MEVIPKHGSDVTTTESLAWQPFWAVVVTEYIPALVTEVNDVDAPLLHWTSTPFPEAFNVTGKSYSQTVMSFPALTLGEFNTWTATSSEDSHPFWSITETV